MISTAEAGQTLADVLVEHVGQDAFAVLAHGGAWLGRERVFDANQQLVEGQELTISRPPDGSYSQLSIEPASIVYEDADLLAIDKPAGTYVEATPWDIGGHLRAAVERFIAERDQISPYVHLVHRLDRDTSGVLLFSKNPSVNAALQASFAGGEVQKRYLCRCAGVPTEDSFECVTGHGRGARGQFRVYPVELVGQTLPQGGGTIKLMRTVLQVVQRDGDSALVEAQPATGRTHQIRLHMAYAGYPLLGDTKYGGPGVWHDQALPYHLLHAAHLELPHPRSNMPLAIEAALPWWASSGQVNSATEG